MGNGSLMNTFPRLLPARLLVVFSFCAISILSISTEGAEKEKNRSIPVRGCAAKVDDFFADQVWAKVGERLCLKCHHTTGKASKSRFLLKDTSHIRDAIQHNREAFERMAKSQSNANSRLLIKVNGGLDHGGGIVLQPESTGYRLLEEYVKRLDKSTDTSVGKGAEAGQFQAGPFFEGVQMMSPQRLLRRLTLSLGGRLPTEQERAEVKTQGLKALNGILDQVMKEDAFFERLKEGFNDIFLTVGYEGNGEEVLSYDHFRTRLWYQKHDLSHLPKKDQQRARWKLADVYRDALLREPMEMIEHIVRNERPFTELVTADYFMMSPYTARGYGVFDKVKHRFKNTDDPFEYIPVRLPALKARNGKVQESKTGYYPHAGILSTFHYLRRYPTTATNRNRLRARMYYQHFLGIDVMALAPRVNDAAAVTSKYEIPTMEAPDCVVCHKSVDPLAGLFQDYNEGGHLGPLKEGWHTDMFKAGFEGERLPKSEKWRALQWLGERTAKDPRFARAMVEHVYYILMGRKVLQPPEDIDDPLFAAKRRAYKEQRKLIEQVAEQFVKANFNLKVVFKELAKSNFYRADGLLTVIEHPCRRAELDDVGIVRLLTPEQLERKIEAVFGEKWGRLTDRESKFKILYGGIDSKAVTERMTEPSGAMGAIQRVMSNDVACKHVVADFAKRASQRRLFPHVELSDVPRKDDDKIMRQIIYLHDHILGRHHSADHPEVKRTVELFAGIVTDAKETKGVNRQADYFCGRVERKRIDDSNYTLRAWRGVVTYLLRQHDFLYE